MGSSIRERIQDFNNLPSLPAAALYVLQLTSDEQISVQDLTATISKDPALSVKVLRAVNSSFYGLSQRVSTVSQAVVLLGIQTIKTLVLSFSLLNSMRSNKGGGLNHLQYWKRSMYAAAGARVLAERLLPNHEEDCFIAALLMDVGTLVLDQMLGEQYAVVLEQAPAHPDLIVAEMHHLGITHAEVSGTLGKHWKLPEILTIPMGSHHTPMEVEDYLHKRITQIIWIGGRCADIFVHEAGAAESIAAVRKTCCDLYQLDPTVVDGILCRIGQKTGELAELFDVRFNSPADFDQILAKANQRLLELTISQQNGELVDKRRSQRVKRDGKIIIVPCDRGVLGVPINAKLRDLSATGVGLTHTERLEEKTQFVIQIPDQSAPGKIKTLLYTVRRCEKHGALYVIGAELVSVLKPEIRISADGTSNAA
ncbi:MAG TPA: HDOD domain-containing protein [Tepidisphaeraceae bacterium]|jgi:HD-like signal output (HDOD) protein